MKKDVSIRNTRPLTFYTAMYDLPGCHAAHELFGLLLMLLRDREIVRGRRSRNQRKRIGTSSYLC